MSTGHLPHCQPERIPGRGQSSTPELPAEQLEALAIQVARFVARRISQPSTQVAPRARGKEIEDGLVRSVPEEGLGLEALLPCVRDGLFELSREQRHPLHFGHQVPAPWAVAALAELAAAAVNTPEGPETGPYAAAVTRCVAHWFLRLAGFPSTGVATFASGGTEASLLALLCARDAAERRAKANGTRMPRLICASEGVHFSIRRAAYVLGLGDDAVVSIPMDGRGAMDVRALERALASVRARGERALAIVATAATTSLGSFDDLRAAVRLGKEHGAWTHVDGSHGASLLLSPTHRHKLDGVDEADSLAWDPHKLLWMPAPCSLLMVRRRSDLVHAMLHGIEHASYVKDQSWNEDSKITETPLMLRLAVTVPFSAFKLYCAMLVYGLSGFRSRVDRVCALASTLYCKVLERPSFEALVEPQANIVCFRYRPEADDLEDDELSRLNFEIRAVLAAGTTAYLTGTTHRGAYWLRAQIMSEHIDELSMDRLLEEIRSVGDRLTAGGFPGGHR